MNKRIIRFISVLLFLTALPFSLTAKGVDEGQLNGSGELVILHTNDFHGHPLKFYNYPAPNVGGLPAIATIAQNVRDQYENVLMLDAGDMNTGRPESNFYESAPDIIGYNYIGYDALTLGNHEFDKVLTTLDEQMKLASFPFLSANVHYPDGSLVAEAPYIIRTFDGFRVGIFGLTTAETPNVTMPTITGDLIFEDEVTVARRMVAELEPKVDVIIALVHMGLYDDNSHGSRKIAANVPGIDLIVDGHSHSKISEPVVVNGTPIVQAWNWGLLVGKAVLTIKDGDVTGLEWETIPVNLKNREKDADGNSHYTFIGEEVPEDPFLLATLTPYAEQVEAKLSEVIGNAGGLFDNTDIRKTEAPLGNLVADAMLWATKGQGSDFAIQNGGGIRAAIPEGEISKKLIYEVLPFDNSVMTVEMTGSEVQAMFDYVATVPRGKGAFPQVSEGVKFTVDFGAGEVRDLTINGRAVDPNATYKVATNSFMAAGGDGYSMMKSGYHYDTSAFQRDVVIDYLQYLGGTINPETEGRITVIEAQ
jgi:5'-nucleotidase/UDP-sugar diphosphatase